MRERREKNRFSEGVQYKVILEDLEDGDGNLETLIAYASCGFPLVSLRDILVHNVDEEHEGFDGIILTVLSPTLLLNDHSFTDLDELDRQKQEDELLRKAQYIANMPSDPVIAELFKEES